MATAADSTNEAATATVLPSQRLLNCLAVLLELKELVVTGLDEEKDEVAISKAQTGEISQSTLGFI